MVSEKELDEIYKKYTEKVNHIRSYIIEEATSLEIQIEWIVSSYFSRNFNDYAVFNYLFFGESNQLGFYDKITMFEKLIETSLKDFLQNNPDIIMRLNKVRKVRNRFAHADATSPDLSKLMNMEKQVFFEIVEKGEVKIVDYTFDFIDDVMEDCKKLNAILSSEIRRLKGQFVLYPPHVLDSISKEA